MKKKILALVDFSEITKDVVNTAVDQARAFSGEIYLLHVEAPEPDFVGYKPGPQVQRDSVSKKIHSNQRRLENIEKIVKKKGIMVRAFLLQGPTTEKILKMQQELKADLMILGSHGHGAMYHLLLGSVSRGIIKGAKCPTLLLPCAKSGKKRR